MLPILNIKIEFVGFVINEFEFSINTVFEKKMLGNILLLGHFCESNLKMIDGKDRKLHIY